MEQAEKDRLLQIARENYPVGTVFESALSPGSNQYTVNTPYWEWHDRMRNDIVINHPAGASIYHEGRWALLVSKPVPVVNNTYSIY